MRFIKNYIFCTLFLALAMSFSSFAEITKKSYGIRGAQLNYHKVPDRKHTYNVRGSDYTVKSVKTAKHYKATGEASYYHKSFNGRRTASGEYFNNNSYTAAHKTLPLNTYVLVTNLRNNRKVIVRINDRGPFVKGRIIDLSKLAAKELGMVHAGVTRVQVEALYVNKNGRISGAGTKSLAKLAKTDYAKNRLDYKSSSQNKISNEKNYKKFNSNVVKNQTSQPAVFYQLRMLGLETKGKAEEIVSKLSGKYNKAHIVKSNQKYDIYFGHIDSKNNIDKLKEDIKMITRSYRFIIYKYGD